MEKVASKVSFLYIFAKKPSDPLYLGVKAWFFMAQEGIMKHIFRNYFKKAFFR